MTETINVAAIDDHPIFLDGLDKVLLRVKGIHLVAKGVSAADALSIAAKYRPDVMLLDITMPGGGIEAARAIRAAQPDVKIITLTASDDSDMVAKAIDSGAHGYLLKGASADELLEAIETVHGGRPYITPSVSARILMQRYNDDTSAPSSGTTLTAREEEILELVAQGLSNQDIADKVGLALPTIKNALSRIFAKLQARSRTQAIAAWRRKA